MSRTTIVKPNIRAARVAAIVEQLNLDDRPAIEMRLTYTPEPLRGLADHATRGRKSLTRIQQIVKRRRFKQRA